MNQWKTEPMLEECMIFNNICLFVTRCKYLRELRRFREAGYDPVFLDETYVNAHHTVEKEWQNMDGTLKRQVPSGKGERLIVVHAGSSEVGFIPNAGLVFKSKSKDNRDYHSEMNGENFGKWLCEKLLPNLERKSLIVFDSAAYHNVVEDGDKIPTTSTKKADIKSWLDREGISYPEKALKPELLNVVRQQRHQKFFKFDKIIKANGHQVLRLPPYHSHLNPIELVWAKVKGEVAAKNTSFKMKDVEVLLNNALDCVDKEYWRKCCLHTLKEEEIYWKRDGLSFIQPEMVINLFSSSEDEGDGI